MEKKKIKFSIGSLFYNKKFAITVSVVAAFIIWMVVVISKTPTIEKTISNIPVIIDTQGTVAGEMGLDEVSGAADKKVTVKVSGPAYIISKLSSDDLAVTVSLSNVTKSGNYELVLSAVKGESANEYSVTSITPSVISTSFDYIDTKQFAVSTKVTGVSAVSGLVAEDPVISESDGGVITVKGPRAAMEKVNSVEARVVANETLSATKTYDADVVLLDKNGDEIDKTPYTLSVQSVKISVPISKMKTVPVIAAFSNMPNGFDRGMLSTTLSVSELTVIGPEATVNNITSVQISPIDFYSLSVKQNSFDVAPVLPDGVKTVEKTETVTVKVDTSGFSQKTFTVSNVIAVNNDAGYNVSLKNSVKNVTICGPSSVIRNLSASDLYACVDLSGKTVGDYTANVTVLSTANTNIWQVGTYQASISVK